MNRPIRPHERAKVDQHMAAARNLAAAEPGTAVFVTESADPGVQCCWCDCTIAQHLAPGGGRDCDGCSADAVLVVSTMGGVLGQRTSYPVCRHHNADFIQTMKFPMLAGIPIDVLTYNAYDEDAHPPMTNTDPDRDFDPTLGAAFTAIEDTINYLARQGDNDATEELEGILLHCQQLVGHIDGLLQPTEEVF